MERGGEPYSPAAAASVLQWWLEAGVDVMVDEAPRDWLRPPAKAPETAPAQAPAPIKAPDDTLPDQLDLFEAWLKDSSSLAFASPSAPRICPSGDPASGLMIMVDMPLTEDCGAGTLLSGEAGLLFDRMMAAIGRDRGSLYLAALSCFRSPDGRFTAETAKQCATLARHHIGLVRPKALLLFGDNCAKALLGRAVTQIRGGWHEIATPQGAVRTLVTFSPSHLLNQPPAKALAWADLQMLAEGLKP